MSNRKLNVNVVKMEGSAISKSSDEVKTLSEVMQEVFSWLKNNGFECCTLGKQIISTKALNNINFTALCFFSNDSYYDGPDIEQMYLGDGVYYNLEDDETIEETVKKKTLYNYSASFFIIARPVSFNINDIVDKLSTDSKMVNYYIPKESNIENKSLQSILAVKDNFLVAKSIDKDIYFYDGLGEFKDGIEEFMKLLLETLDKIDATISQHISDYLKRKK